MHIAAGGGQRLEAGDVGLSDGGVVVLGKQQGDVDVQPLADQRFNRRHTRRRTRHLDHQVGAIDIGRQSQGFVDRPLRVICQIGRHLQRHVTVGPFRRIEYGAQHIGGGLNVTNGQSLVDLQRRQAGGGVPSQIVGIVLRSGDGLFEDRRV